MDTPAMTGPTPADVNSAGSFCPGTNNPHTWRVTGKYTQNGQQVTERVCDTCDRPETIRVTPPRTARRRPTGPPPRIFHVLRVEDAPNLPAPQRQQVVAELRARSLHLLTGDAPGVRGVVSAYFNTVEAMHASAARIKRICGRDCTFTTADRLPLPHDR